MRTFQSKLFKNGLKIEFKDRSHRYFGDYYRLRIEVVFHLDLNTVMTAISAPECFWQKVHSKIGEHVLLKKSLERMAVPSKEVEKIRQLMVDDFLTTNTQYLSTVGYVRKLLEQQIDKPMTKRNYGF